MRGSRTCRRADRDGSGRTGSNAATAPFDDPQLRSTVIAIHRRAEQVIDRVSIDRVTEAAYSAEATERARATVESFRQFIETHRDEITALQMIYGRPYAQRRLTFAQVKELADRLATTQPNWTTEACGGAICNWRATRCAARRRSGC